MTEQNQPTVEPHDQPVTVIVRRRVKPGHEAQYGDWLRRLQSAARNLPGYLGVTTQQPGSGAPREYVSIIRFASPQALQAFEQSDLRAQYLLEVTAHVEADAIWQQLTGLEFWFAPPPGTVVPQPSRARMAMLMVAVVFGLVLSIGSLVGAAAALLPFAVPYPVRLLLTIVIEVLLMTYWLMPKLTKHLAFWIYPARRAA